MSDLSDKGLLALLVLAAGAVLRWLQQRPIKAARRRAEAAADAAQEAQHAAVHEHQAAQEAAANATLAQEQQAITLMGNSDIDADAAARVERDRAERAAARERHHD